VINLASNEYFRAIDGLNAEVITPVFLERRDDRVKIISFFAKKARGAMARFIITERIERRDDLQAFELLGYRFDQARSEASRPAFIR
jgi:cytoplasmic iron level regulating protein YaaA (DUF328/UPF0246 family)